MLLLCNRSLTTVMLEMLAWINALDLSEVSMTLVLLAPFQTLVQRSSPSTLNLPPSCRRFLATTQSRASVLLLVVVAPALELELEPEPEQLQLLQHQPALQAHLHLKAHLVRDLAPIPALVQCSMHHLNPLRLLPVLLLILPVDQRQLQQVHLPPLHLRQMSPRQVLAPPLQDGRSMVAFPITLATVCSVA